MAGRIVVWPSKGVKYRLILTGPDFVNHHFSGLGRHNRAFPAVAGSRDKFIVPSAGGAYDASHNPFGKSDSGGCHTASARSFGLCRGRFLI